MHVLYMNKKIETKILILRVIQFCMCPFFNDDGGSVERNHYSFFVNKVLFIWPEVKIFLQLTFRMFIIISNIIITIDTFLRHSGCMWCLRVYQQLME